MSARVTKPIGWALLLLAGTLLLLFALIGILHTFRGTPIQRVQIAGTDASRLEVMDPAFRSTAELLTGARLLGGNQVELLLNEEVLQRLREDLRAARSSIAFRNYYTLPGAVADTFVNLLADRARAGVRVMFLYDAFGSELSRAHLQRLEQAGVLVASFRPLGWLSLNRAQNRSHVRAVVIDGTIGYTGGFGLADHWLGDGLREGSWRDTSVRFEGPAVMQLQAAFSIGWAEATGTLLAGPVHFHPRGFAPAGDQIAGLLFTAPTEGSTPAERFLVLSIAGASRSLYISNSYFVPDDDQRRLLRQAARRGVDVRVLTAGRRSDVAMARLAGRAHYESLLRAGVRIYEYQPTMIHAKTLVADGMWATVGTMNFDYRSATLNEESNLVMLDARLGARLDSIFLEDLRHARELHLEDFARRPWHEKVRERTAVLLSRIL